MLCQSQAMLHILCITLEQEIIWNAPQRLTHRVIRLKRTVMDVNNIIAITF